MMTRPFIDWVAETDYVKPYNIKPIDQSIADDFTRTVARYQTPAELNGVVVSMKKYDFGGDEMNVFNDEYFTREEVNELCYTYMRSLLLLKTP